MRGSAGRGLGLGIDGAKALSGAVVTFTLSFVVFTFGSLLVAIQVASGQYTPRIIATTLLRDNVIRYTVGVFVFTLLFAVKALNRIEDDRAAVGRVHRWRARTHLPRGVSLSHRLRRAAAASGEPREARRRRRSCGCSKVSIPRSSTDAPSAATSPPQDAGPVERTILHRGTSGIILAVNMPQLIAEAEKANGVIEFAPQVGDFVGADEPLFLLHGGAAAIDDDMLRGLRDLRLRAHAWSRIRCSAFRILVDIAIKALSAAINDPTTAVLAIDQLHRVLRSAGRRNLRADSILGPTGKLRVIFRTPDWNDFVHLAFVEIRFYGASNVQIARRLRAMIVNLANTLPAERHAALRQEFELLDRMLEKLYVLPEDLALARIPDSQGLGGSTDTTTPKWAA